MGISKPDGTLLSWQWSTVQKMIDIPLGMHVDQHLSLEGVGRLIRFWAKLN